MKLTSATRVTYIYPRSPYCRPNNPDLWPDVTRQQLDSKLLAGSMIFLCTHINILTPVLGAMTKACTVTTSERCALSSPLRI